MLADDIRMWWEAKDRKDFDEADRIRTHLRAHGIEPAEQPRPGGSKKRDMGFGKASVGADSVRASPYGSSGGFDWQTESNLDMWWQFKQEKNWAAADALRASLRSQGIEPEQHRPAK